MAGLEKADPSVEKETFYLVNRHHMQNAIDCCRQSDVILMAFPLYTDAMPGIVKLFFEQMPLFRGKKIGYMVQSGFPEAIHCFYLEKYLEGFTRKLEATYLGTVTRGNVEGIQDRTAWMNKRLYSKYWKLGYSFGRKGELDPTIIRDLKKPFVLSPVTRVACRLVLMTGFSDYGWNQHLKSNKVFALRYAKPFQMRIDSAEER
jgi:hypothetical protein